MRRISLFLLALTILAFAGCGNRAPQSRKYVIAVIPKGTTHEFWKSIHAGAVKAQDDLSKQGINVTVNWKGPLREDEREQQIQVVEGFIGQGTDGIVLAPLDKSALVRPVEEAARGGIPTLIIDSALESNNIVSFVATDNLKGGELAADRMGTLLHGKGNVILLRYQENSASNQEREEGFLRKLESAYPDIRVISSDQYGGPTRETAKRTSENLLNQYGDAVHGVFCPNEPMTIGMLLALQDINKAGKIALVGFDATETLTDAMRKEQLQGLVVQNPFRMGELGVKTMMDHLLGKPIKKRIDTGVMLITPENIDEPQAKELLNPPLQQYLR